MNVVFMGTPEFATQILRDILDANINVLALVCAVDKKVGRNGKISPPNTKKWLLQHNKNIKILQPINLRGDEIRAQICALKPDFIVVAAYGQILTKEILQIAPCINLHASILPKFRGASPIQSMILNGEKYFGITAMKMGVGLDDGDMLGFSVCENLGENSAQLFEKLAKMAGILCVKTLRNFDKLSSIKQNGALASKCTKIAKSDGLIQFSDDVSAINAKFLAFCPWPGIFFENGVKILDLKAHLGTKFSHLGVITKITKSSFCVSFQNGEIEVFAIQEPTKKPLKANDFINGKRLKVGDKIF